MVASRWVCCRSRISRMALASASARLPRAARASSSYSSRPSFKVRQQILDVPGYRFQQLAADGFVETVIARSHQGIIEQPQRFGFGSAGVRRERLRSVGLAPAGGHGNDLFVKAGGARAVERQPARARSRAEWRRWSGSSRRATDRDVRNPGRQIETRDGGRPGAPGEDARPHP